MTVIRFLVFQIIPCTSNCVPFQKYGQVTELLVKSFLLIFLVFTFLFLHSFWVNNKLYFGSDRIHFVERDLGKSDAAPPRLVPSPLPSIKKRKLAIYHDYASPWSYIGSKQVSKKISSLRTLHLQNHEMSTFAFN